MINTNLVCDLQQAVKVQYLDGVIFSQDAAANTINVNVYDGGEPASLSGTVSANIIRVDGGTVPGTGSISGNRASVTLPAAAYAYPGLVSIVIKITSGSTVATIAAVVANVYESTTSTPIDPGTIIPDINTLIAEIEAAVASVPADYSALLGDIASDYSNEEPYKVGEYCWHNGDLKRCIVAINSPETYTAAHWEDAVIGDDVSDLKSAISGSQDYVFEIGSLYYSSGLPADNNARIRSNPFYAKKGQVFSITTGENLLGLFQYDYDGNFVTCITNGSFYSTATAPANGIYRIVMKKDAAGSTFTEADIPLAKAKISPDAVEFPLPFINRDNLEKFEEQTNTNFEQIDSEFNGISEHVKTLTTTYDTNDLSPSAGYINTSGGISGTSGSSGYYYSANTVHAYAGDIITLISSTANFASVTVIAKYLSAGSYMPLVLGASNKSTYTFTVQDEGDYAFTLGGGTNTITLVSQPSFDRELQDIDNSFFALDSKNYLPLFRKCACLGDSLTRGFNTTYPSGERNRDFGYPWVLARKTQLQVWNYGHSGATPSYLYTYLQNTDFSSFDMAIICLGRNGGIESEADQTAYQSLITKLLTDNEHMTIFICSLPAYGSTISAADVAINARIQAIAAANNLPYIDIWGDYGGAEYRTGDVHYNPMGYVKMCNAIIKGINNYIDSNLSEYLNLWMPGTMAEYIDGQVE